MVAWRMLSTGNEVEVTFDVEEVAAWRDFRMKSYGIAALQTLLVSLESSGNAAEVVIDTSETKRRRYLSLPEAYYAAAIDGVLPVEESLRDLWGRFKSSSATFTRHFVVYQHFRRLEWTPKSGLNYGAHYVLYRGSAAEFHSEYVVYLADSGESLSWNTIQSLTRIAADVKKTVLLCTVTAETASVEGRMATSTNTDLTFGAYSFHDVQYKVEATAIRFWDASVANEPHSYTFKPQPVVLKKIKTGKKKNRVKRPKNQLDGDTLTGSGNST